MSTPSTIERLSSLEKIVAHTEYVVLHRASEAWRQLQPHAVLSLLEKANLKLTRNSELQPEHSLFNSVHILQRVLDNPYYQNADNLREMLSDDLEDVVKEFILAEDITPFRLWIRDRKLYGEGYVEHLEELAQNCIDDREQKAGWGQTDRPSRFEIERQNKVDLSKLLRIQARGALQTLLRAANQNQLTNLDSERLKAALLASLQQTVQLWISPPGKEYHGSRSEVWWGHWRKEDHHSMFYAYGIENLDLEIAQDETGHWRGEIKEVAVLAKQYRGWPNLRRLAGIQQELGQAPQPAKDEPLTHAVVRNLLQVHSSRETAQLPLKTLATQLGVTAYELATSDLEMTDLEKLKAQHQSELTEQLKQVIQRDSYLWPTQITDAPDVDLDQFVIQYQRVLNFYLAAVVPRFETLWRSNRNRSAEDVIAQGDPENQKWLKEIDWAFSCFQASLRKWVENHDQDPQAIKKRSRKSAGEMPDDIPVHTLRKTYQAWVKKGIRGEELTLTEQEQLQKSNLQALLSESVGASQCGSIGSLQAVGGAVEKVSDMGSLPEFENLLKNLNFTEKRDLYQLLTSQEYFELRLLGAEQVWMVPKSYLYDNEGNALVTEDGKPGCWVNDEGEVVGPCGLLLKDELQIGALPMTKDQFMSFLKTLETQLSEGQLESLEDLINETQLTQEQRLRAETLLTELKESLLKKTVGIMEVINSDVIQSAPNTLKLSSNSLVLTWEQFDLIKNATNPLIVLEELVQKTTLTNSTVIHPSEPAATLPEKQPVQLAA